MQKILENHCLNKDANGLLLLSLPTGFGKTYKVLDFIYNHYLDFAEQNRKIVFVTNLKKNLPYKDLKKRFKEKNAENDFENHVLFIDSNANTVIDRLLTLDDKIPDKFKTESYYELKSRIEALSGSEHLNKNLKKSIEDDILKNLEPKFRQSISSHLQTQYDTKKKRLNAIKNNPDYQWIGELYPSVFTDEKTVLFLSMDKLVQKNTTVIEKSYYFHNRLLKNAVVFIDEFDSTKERVLNNIIESGLQHRVDLLDLFLNIHSHLTQREIPENLLIESEDLKQRRMESNRILSPDGIVDNFQKKADNIFKKYNLQHTYKSHKDFSSEKRNFLFYDYQFHHVLDARYKQIEVINDPANRTNWITVAENDKDQSRINIRNLLGEISGFLKYFQGGIKYLADNYFQLKKENNAENAFTFESAVRTVLNQLRLDESNVEFMTKNIMENDIPYYSRFDKVPIYNSTFYDTGFHFHDIVDNEEHDTLSKIYMYKFSMTPESFLLNICSQSMVVGLSATAGLNTNIGNYDLEYLKYRLGDNFFRVSNEQLQNLEEHFHDMTHGYEKIDIKTDFIETENFDNSMNQLQTLLDDEEAAKYLWNYINLKNDESESKENEIEYIFSRYVRVLKVWKYFLVNSDIHAFLCFFNKFPKSKDWKFDLEIIREYADMIREVSGIYLQDNIENVISVIDSNNFDENKSNLSNDLGNGKRKFIISTYQTIGAGQNLQYPIPETVNPVKINNYVEQSEMDIDAVYLDRPTNLLVNISNKNLEPKDFVKYLFQLEFLLENGAISPKTFSNKLDEAFHSFVGRYRKKKTPDDFVNLYKTNPFSRFINKVVIQSIGRICRTNMKAPIVHILADSYIQQHLAQTSLPEDVIPVKEYTTLLDSAKKTAEISTYIDEFQNRASNISNKNVAFIYHYLKTDWTEEHIETWNELREQVIRHPVIENKGTCNPRWKGIYIDLPEPNPSYKYKQKGDYSDVEVFFTNKLDTYEVSEKSARLPELMSVEPLRNYFEENGWMTTFPVGELIISPPIFNNIYKGVLGEVCGHHILQNELDIELEELDIPEFELFDFKTPDGIYIDFKLWNDQIAISADEELSKIREKMNICQAKRVFIINILGSKDAEFRPIFSKSGKIVEVPFLCKNQSLDYEALKFVKEEFCK